MYNPPKCIQQAVSVCSEQRYECANCAEASLSDRLKSSDVPTLPLYVRNDILCHLNMITRNSDLLVLVVVVVTGAGEENRELRRYQELVKTQQAWAYLVRFSF